MFNFNEIYSQNENIPWKYNYQQEYAFIIHNAFNKPYVNILKSDKEDIVKIILKFNEYYKSEIYRECGKFTNAPLYCCSLISVLELPKLSKYKGILELIPLKERSTYTNINAKWFKFVNDNYDFIKQWMLDPPCYSVEESPEDSSPKTDENIFF
jgi:hypothetical protein